MNNEDIDLTHLGRKNNLGIVASNETDSLIKGLDDILSSPEKIKDLEEKAKKTAKDLRLKRLESQLLNKKDKLREEDWERSGTDEALWRNIIYFGLQQYEKVLPKLTYDRFRLALLDAYRLGLIGIENEINKKTADCLNKYQQHKATNAELRKQIKNLEKQLK